MIKRKTENKILAIVVGTTVLLTSTVLAVETPPAYAQSHYQIGYDDGCAGRVVPGPHTSDYRRGYADGQAACSQHPGSSPNPPSSPSPKQSVSGQQPGYTLTVHVTGHRFGVNSVHVSVKTANGYTPEDWVATNQPDPSISFQIGPNQGDSVEVCVANDFVGAILGGNCKTYAVTGGNMDVSQPAG